MIYKYTKKQLYNKYIIKKLSTVEIAKKLNTNKNIILKLLHFYKIPVRNLTEAQILRYKRNPSEVKKAVERLKPGRFGKENPNYKHGKTNNNKCIDCNKKINNFYAKRCKSCARKHQYFINPKSHPMLGRHHLESTLKKISQGGRGKKRSLETRQRISKAFRGKNNPMFGCKKHLNPNWQGGKSFEIYPLEFNDEVKELIRKRDNYKCKLCNKSQKKDSKNFNRKLSIHHIDYNKKNCIKNNLISLCFKCHMLTNYNRDFWYAYFKYFLGE